MQQAEPVDHRVDAGSAFAVSAGPVAGGGAGAGAGGAPGATEGGSRAQQRRAEREAVERRAADEWRAHEQRALEQQRAQERELELQAQRAAAQLAHDRAAAQRAAADRDAAERDAAQRVAAQRAAAQRDAEHAAEQAHAAQRRAAEQLRAEQEFAAQRRAAEDRHAQQQRLAEQRLAAQHYEEEQRASERRYAEQQRAAAQRHPEPVEPEPAIDDFAALLAGVADVDASHHFLDVPDSVVEESARRDRRRGAESKIRTKGKRGARQKGRGAGGTGEILMPAGMPASELDIAFASADHVPHAPRRTAPAPAASRPAPAAASRPGSRPMQSGSSLRRAIASRTVSLVAMGFVAMLAVATSVPSLSLLTAQDVQAMALGNAVEGAEVDGQRVDISGAALAAPVGREAYQAQTIEEYAAAAGIRVERTFTNNPLGTIQWPFAVGVHIGDRFGYRDCAGCSSNHGGQDFNPGLGAQIQSIADGVVVNSTDSGGSLGVVIMIDHVIDGQLITSVYAHMEYGSRRFEVGDTVAVGDVIGTTGDTGMSTGPHLHFEIRIGGVNGTKVDPLVWLYENTN